MRAQLRLLLQNIKNSEKEEFTPQNGAGLMGLSGRDLDEKLDVAIDRHETEFAVEPKDAHPAANDDIFIKPR